MCQRINFSRCDRLHVLAACQRAYILLATVCDSLHTACAVCSCVPERERERPDQVCLQSADTGSCVCARSLLAAALKAANRPEGSKPSSHTPVAHLWRPVLFKLMPSRRCEGLPIQRRLIIHIWSANQRLPCQAAEWTRLI